MRLLSALGLVLVLAPGPMFAQLGTNQAVTATLTGYQEVPAVSSDGIGYFNGVVRLSSSGATSLLISLQWSNLSDPGAPTSIDIRFAQEGVNGGQVITLCGGGNPYGCPTNGKISGVINPGDLRNLPVQNIAFDDFDKFLRALFAGKLYVQIKSTRVPTGEIRGQIKPLAFQ